ncbi:glycoside hydrolase family 66 protein [Herbiconiux sp.]|uniref:glycoside hydrolase family 66 protein n=1 Tax=Herbiconiux sp. TaxID=1871186 RepID=UPI0025B8A4D4|nr:glycoside hydrolase family 66 protein [Herbiconiux sp.]
MHQPTLLPTRAQYAPDEEISLEIDSAVGDVLSGTLSVWRLGRRIHEQPITADALQHLPGLPEGGYGVEARIGEAVHRTAVEVTADARSRLRYGFVASYRPDKDVDAVARLARRLHLNGVQFYDWAYRHADLLGGGEHYDDALGQPIELETVTRLIRALKGAGSVAHGYAAVYAVGPAEWDRWADLALLRPSGEPYALGDFLFLVDPAAPRWAEHFGRELVEASRQLGFDGFHLDQYGYPKFAAEPGGHPVDVAESFVTLLAGLRAALPDTSLIFNNVNDFPTWRTASTEQDAVYIEPWKPNSDLGSLAQIVSRARLASAGQPVVIAAYQHVYDSAAAHEADRATSFTMATLFSHGATQLLAGESGHVLVDPYYVRNHRAEESTLDLLARWYDFVVEHDALLMPPSIAEVTRSYVGDYNDDLELSYPGTGAAVSETAVAGTVWRRVTTTPEGLVVHAINLVGQEDTLWDAPRRSPEDVGDGELRFRPIRGRMPRVSVADPDRQARLVEVPVRLDGDHAVASLPAPHIWQVIHVAL